MSDSSSKVSRFHPQWFALYLWASLSACLTPTCSQWEKERRIDVSFSPLRDGSQTLFSEADLKQIWSDLLWTLQFHHREWPGHPSYMFSDLIRCQISGHIECFVNRHVRALLLWWMDEWTYEWMNAAPIMDAAICSHSPQTWVSYVCSLYVTYVNSQSTRLYRAKHDLVELKSKLSLAENIERNILWYI